MRVKIHIINQTTGALEPAVDEECDLAECGLEGEEAIGADIELRERGATLIGGGASPLVLLVRVLEKQRVPALERRYPPGCPDADWCAGNNVCYWDCCGQLPGDPADDIEEAAKVCPVFRTLTGAAP